MSCVGLPNRRLSLSDADCVCFKPTLSFFYLWTDEATNLTQVIIMCVDQSEAASDSRRRDVIATALTAVAAAVCCYDADVKAYTRARDVIEAGV